MFTFRCQAPPGQDINQIYKMHKEGVPQVFLDALNVREDVFCTEQGFTLDLELDDDEPRSWQWVFYEGSEPVGVIRLVPPPHHPHPNGFQDELKEPYIKLTRVAIKAAAREKGLGRLLTETALNWATTHRQEIGPDWKGLVLVYSQLSVEKFYEKLGFKTDPRLGQWEEEGVLHLGMWKRIEVQR